MSYYEPPQPDYDTYSNKQLLAVPIVLILISLSVLGAWFLLTGAPVDRGMEFVGGTEVRVQVDTGVSDPVGEIESTFSATAATVQPVPASDGEYIVTFAEGETTAETLEQNAQSSNIEITQLSQVAASLGSGDQEKALLGMGAAFILMSLFVIMLFRSVIPAVVVIASAISDVLVPLAVMNLVGIELSFGTVGALLMLIGYSVDSDILLNTYVLRGNKRNFVDNVHDAMRTGITMTTTSISVMVVMTIVAQIFGVGLLRDIGFILVVGLFVDLVNTYMMNVGILRWYTGDTA